MCAGSIPRSTRTAAAGLVLYGRDPDRRDPEFDIYDAACPHQAPYSEEFVAHFRAAQIARNRKITAWPTASSLSPRICRGPRP